MELESDKQKLALLELDILTDDLEFHDKFELQRDELDKGRSRLERMEKQHKELESNLSEQIIRLVFLLLKKSINLYVREMSCFFAAPSYQRMKTPLKYLSSLLTHLPNCLFRGTAFESFCQMIFSCLIYRQ